MVIKSIEIGFNDRGLLLIKLWYGKGMERLVLFMVLEYCKLKIMIMNRVFIIKNIKFILFFIFRRFVFIFFLCFLLCCRGYKYLEISLV